MAQYDLGVMYSSGTGVQEDQTEAVKWYRMAAEQGDADAQHNLGVMYDNGAGVPEDDVEAYAWFSVVATGGQIRGEKFRDSVKEQLTAEQLAEAQKRATELFEKYGSGK
jgi:TPR repeat protein